MLVEVYRAHHDSVFDKLRMTVNCLELIFIFVASHLYRKSSLTAQSIIKPLQKFAHKLLVLKNRERIKSIQFEAFQKVQIIPQVRIYLKTDSSRRKY